MLSGGPIGVLDDGILLYDALDGEGRDAVAHEILDSCDGHPDQSDTYHHHDVPSCILQRDGRRLDPRRVREGRLRHLREHDAHGTLLTNASLDACHGRTSAVSWNGKRKVLYHYDATLEYPYTVGCYHGTPIKPPNPAGWADPGVRAARRAPARAARRDPEAAGPSGHDPVRGRPQ